MRRLTRAERAALQRIAKGASERVDQVRRATALLAVARTGAFIHAAREAGLRSGTTAADLVVVVRHELTRDGDEVLLVHNDYVVEALSP